jgi:hypothetical protein
MQDSMRPEDTDGLTQTDEAERSADRLSVRPTVRSGRRSQSSPLVASAGLPWRVHEDHTDTDRCC